MSEKDHFREDFKYYKRKIPIPCFKEVVDFDSKLPAGIVFETIKNSSSSPDLCHVCQNLGLVHHTLWLVNTIPGYDGFLHLKNPFCAAGQRKWIQKCLEVYPCKPSVTNLDLHCSNIDNIWSLRSSRNPIESNYLQKLCWATFGYHHNWDTKVYNPNHKSKFPECLKKLSEHIADCLGFSDFIPEAAIVNYYHLKSSLGIHNDHSEENLNAPIISFSFGQTGLFLIGTGKKTDKPAAVFLRSGDIVIMSDSSRLAYHAVPCIIPEDVRYRYSDPGNKNNDWLEFEEYIQKSRINVNVRQVYTPR